MKQYILKQIGNNEPIGKYSNKADAVDDMDTIIADHNEDLDSDDDGFLTPFDFTIEVVECQDVNETITNFDEARAFLGGKPNNDYTVSKKVLSGNCVQLADVTHLVQDVNPKHIKALIALNELFTIAQAWNKADDFVPDFSNSMQDKWFPWFVYDKGTAGFVYARTNLTRRRLRLRLSVLGFASKHEIEQSNSANSSWDCTTKFSCLISKNVSL